MGRKRAKPTARQRAARRYWNDVRAIAARRDTTTARARRIYSAALNRFDLDRRELNRAKLLKATDKVRRVAALKRKKPRPRVPDAPASPATPAPPDWVLVWKGRAFAFSIRAIYENDIRRRLEELGYPGFYAIAIEILGPDGKLLETNAYGFQFTGHTIDGWFDAYHNSIRREAGIGRGAERGGRKLYERIKTDHKAETFSIQVTRILKR